MTHCRLDLEQPDGSLRRAWVRPGTPFAHVVRTAEGGRTPMAGTRHVEGTEITASDVVGRPPLLDGALVALGAPGPRAGLELVVVGGPSTGRRAPLENAPVTVGRATDAGLRLDDPSVSRRHAVVRLAGGVVTVTDLGTTNGTTVDEHTLHARSAECPPETTIHVGASALVVRTAERPAGRPSTTDGLVRVPATPRPAPTPRRHTLERPDRPRDDDLRRLNPTMLLAPLAASVVMAAALHSPLLLLLGLTGPLVLLGTTVSDRRAGRRRRGVALREHAAALAAVEADLAQACRAEAAGRRLRATDTARAVSRARRRHELWGAPPGAGAWCPGRGRSPAGTVVVRGEDPPDLDDVPVVVPLAAGSDLAVVGDDPRAAVRALVAQLVTDLPPHLLQLAVLADDRVRHREWSWTELLPHRRCELDDVDVLTRADGRDRNTTTGPGRREPTGPSRAERTGPLVLVVCDAPPTDVPTLPGAVVVRLDPAASTTHTLRLGDPGPGRATLVTPDGTTVVTADGLDHDAARSLARALCPVRCTATDAAPDLPDAVALLDVLGHDPLDPDALAVAWRSRTGLGPVPLGAGADGVTHLDLVHDGPHALVGGTTGAGKSELVTTLVTSLALTHPPDRVAVLVIDFKGGATGSALSGLPHVCDVITDLDPGTAARALTGLEAELKRRERVLARAGATHADDVPDLPRLLVVVDEFRVLAEEHPAFLAGLLRVAATGRSLGVHLLLATQRPAGIVSADVRANVSLRIALRVNDVHESTDVIGAPDAAHIPPTRPGRAVVRRPDGSLTEVQVARAGARPARDEPDVLLDPGESAAAEGDAELLTCVVAAAQEAAERLGLARAPSPVPRPLPDTVDGHALVDAHDGPGLPLGIVDLPHQQRQEPLVHDRTDGHLAVVGVARSGRSTVARQAVHAALAARTGPAVHVVGPKHVWSGLRAARLRSCIDPRDTRLVAHLLDRLRTEAGGPSLLVVDGWPSVVAGADPLTTLRLQDALTRLLAEGPAAGVHAVITGDRTLLIGSVAAHLTRRLVLRLADATDLALVGLPPSLGAAWARPGRAVRACDGAIVQLALPPDEHRPDHDTDGWGPVLKPLPDRVTVAPGAGIIGRGGDEARPVVLDVGTVRTLLVVGPGGSGRSTTLVTLARSCGRPVVAVGVPPHGLDATTLTRVEASADPAELEAALADRPGAVVLVDDLRSIMDGPLDAALVAVAERARRPVLVGAHPTDVTGAYRGLAGLARRNRTGIVLAPTAPADGEPLGCRLDGLDRQRPGRGVLVSGARQTVLQVGVIGPDVADHPDEASPATGEPAGGGTMGR